MSALEAAAAKGPLAGSLAEGVETLSLNQTITFTRYLKRVLPADGYVFWIKSTLVLNPPAPATITVKGSMHFASEQVQREDETFGVNHMVFTSLSQVDAFNEVDPDEMWLGAFEGLRFSFARRNSFYKQADLHHYVGDAVYPAMETQIIDTPEALAALTDRVVVSNSLPIWLTLDAVVQPYPSFLVAENIVPPYAAIHIPPEATTALQAVPLIDRQSSHWQLAKDRVVVTLYGLDNAQVMDWLDDVIDYMSNSDDLGLMSTPIVRDAKRTQSELTVLAMKKVVEFEVSYYQAAVRDIARKFILSATIALSVSDL